MAVSSLKCLSLQIVNVDLRRAWRPLTGLLACLTCRSRLANNDIALGNSRLSMNLHQGTANNVLVQLVLPMSSLAHGNIDK